MALKQKTRCHPGMEAGIQCHGWKHGLRLRTDVAELLPSLALDTRIPAGMTPVVCRKLGGMAV